MEHLSPEMRACIEACLRCHSTCLSMAMGHCLEQGGAHTDPEHLRLMMACAEICQTSANMMLIGTPHHRHTCRECAEICEECARSCQQLDGMEACVEDCRRCAESCAKMAA
ncbi:MAG: four-helix bundle copper-binding protein [Rhodospirillales bacterium]|nr:four-helix bundle copper-binding protein [Rhodospirillales bacterium]MBN8896580.1 four-helix bundle copper-binding protein [Rhodospirillales bacterium]